MIRIAIYPSDIVLLTDKSERYARRVINDLKRSLNKEKHQIVTIKEYCQYNRLDLDVVIVALRSLPTSKPH